MTIHEKFAAAFNAAKIPGFRNRWKPSDEYPKPPTVYAVYLLKLHDGALYADDELTYGEYSLRVDLYANTDLTEIGSRLQAALESQGIELFRSRDFDDVRGGEIAYHRCFDGLYTEYRP